MEACIFRILKLHNRISRLRIFPYCAEHFNTPTSHSTSPCSHPSLPLPSPSSSPRSSSSPSLLLLLQEREELAEIDLRKVTELKPPDTFGSLEAQSTFQILLSEKVYLLKADTPAEAESWISALKHTQVGRKEGGSKEGREGSREGRRDCSEEHVAEINHVAQK